MYQPVQSICFCGCTVPVTNCANCIQSIPCPLNYFSDQIPVPDFNINPFPAPQWSSNSQPQLNASVGIVETNEEPLDLSFKANGVPPVPENNEQSGMKRGTLSDDVEISVPIYFKKWKQDKPPRKNTRKQLQPRQKLKSTAAVTSSSKKAELSGLSAKFHQKSGVTTKIETNSTVPFPHQSKGVVVVHLGDGDVDENFERALGKETWEQIVHEKNEQMKKNGDKSQMFLDSTEIHEMTKRFMPDSKVIIIENSGKASVNDHFARALGPDTWSSIMKNGNGGTQFAKIYKKKGATHVKKQSKQLPARPIPIRPGSTCSMSRVGNHRSLLRFNIDHLLNDETHE